MTPLDAAIDYTERGWPVFPVRSGSKVPLTPHGRLDATCDLAAIGEWWHVWPDAIPSIVTGEESGIVGLDVDIRPGGSGFDTLEAMGVAFHPESPTAHTPQGGGAVLFRWPGHPVRTSAGKLGRFLDVRGDGGSLILPPGPGQFWDPHLGLDDVAIAPMPEWMVIAEPEPVIPSAAPPVRQHMRLSPYGEAALDDAVKAIVDAPDGRQHETLNRQVYGIAQLVAGGVVPSPLALEALQWAARQMRSHDSRRPWRAADISKAVQVSFLDGLTQPRRPNGRAA